MANTDPTRTATLRQRYAQNMNNRFLTLAADVRKSFIDNDALNVRNLVAAAKGQFDFPLNSDKNAAFLTWIQDQIDSGILEVIVTRRNLERVSTHWQDAFLKSAYIRGIKDTESKLKQQGGLVSPLDNLTVSLSTGQNLDTLQLIYSRAFEGLKGITGAMSGQLSEIFTQALIEGVGPKVIAKRITDRISTISKNRAMVLARTETIRAFSEASLNIMERNNIEAVEADVEFSTAGDGRVCPRCSFLNGKTYTIKQARGVIPVHPRCVTENSMITHSPYVNASFKYRYNGDAYRFTTEEGRSVECTPNHPILTSFGWLPARVINPKKHTIINLTREYSGINLLDKDHEFTIAKDLHNHIEKNLTAFKKRNYNLTGREFFNDCLDGERCDILYLQTYNNDMFRNWNMYEDDLGYEVLNIIAYSENKLYSTPIKSIEKFNYCGNVYDLETQDGYFCVNGIVVHNCRCRWLPVVKGVEGFRRYWRAA